MTSFPDQNLTKQKCEPCEIGTPPLTEAKENELMQQLTGWELDRSATHLLRKKYSFKNFAAGLAFVNRVGELAEHEGHHPNVLLYNYKHVKIELYTHKINGLSYNDFIMAAKIDQLV